MEARDRHAKGMVIIQSQFVVSRQKGLNLISRTHPERLIMGREGTVELTEKHGPPRCCYNSAGRLGVVTIGVSFGVTHRSCNPEIVQREA